MALPLVRCKPRHRLCPDLNRTVPRPRRNIFKGWTTPLNRKQQIDKIHRDTETRKAAVEKDEKLNQDQKDAMLSGFTHLEYGAIFKVLTPEQQKQVREKIRARKAADEAAQKKQAPQS